MLDIRDLSGLGEEVRESFSEKNAARDIVLAQSRLLIRFCAETIRAIHREDFDLAREKLASATEKVAEMLTAVANYSDLYYAGYTQDGLKEYVEANLVLALVTDKPLPGPKDLQVEYSTYLKGLGEAATEMRRRILDIIRNGHSSEAERLLASMDEIYSLMVTIDFPDAITHGLRRQTDIVRSVVERTRGDLTTSLRQQQLQTALQQLSGKVDSEN